MSEARCQQYPKLVKARQVCEHGQNSASSRSKSHQAVRKEWAVFHKQGIPIETPKCNSSVYRGPQNQLLLCANLPPLHLLFGGHAPSCCGLEHLRKSDDTLPQTSGMLEKKVFSKGLSDFPFGLSSFSGDETLKKCWFRVNSESS